MNMKNTKLCGMAALLTVTTVWGAVPPDLAASPVVDTPGTNKLAPAGALDPEQLFLTPPESAKPGVLWMWMGSNLSESGIKQDLQALKAAGFGRTTMFNVADIITPCAYDIPNSPTPERIAWTEPWWKLVRVAAEESKRLGMDFGIFNSAGYEASGGVWITPQHAMKEICFSETAVEGGQGLKLQIPIPGIDLHTYQGEPSMVHNTITGALEYPIIPERKTAYLDIAVLALPAEGIVTAGQIVDLSGKMSSAGAIQCDLPEGKWKIYRFGHTIMGNGLHPAQSKARGFECDKMSREAVEFHLDHIIGDIRKHVGDLIGTGLTHVHFDSYEAGTPSWTPRMREEFSSRRKYDLLPYLPAFAKRMINSEQETQKFKQDFNATIKDLYSEVYFATIQQKLHGAGLDFLCEPYGGPWRQDDVVPKVDRIMTEFWTGGGRYSGNKSGEYTPFEVEPTIAALRKTQQNLIEAEAYTGWPEDSKYTETPEWLKPIGDAAFCAGINRMVLAAFCHQPWSDRYKPGQSYGQWGTHFDRTQTWWEPGKAFFAYLHRCQALLLWGRYASLKGDFQTQPVSNHLKAIHRSDGTSDIFFVANTRHIASQTTCAFAVVGKQPELWDPVTATLRDLPDYTVTHGTTVIPMQFEPAQSFFVVFRKPGKAQDTTVAVNFPALRPVIELTGPWQVQFDPQWGGPVKPVTFTTLTDWTQNPTPGIRYFSGTAVYRQTVDSTPVLLNQDLYLDLGSVRHIARVKLNGQDLGVIWCAPWRMAIPSRLWRMKNQLEIEVTNVWANRLIGDEQEPDDCQWKSGPWEGTGRFLEKFPDWFLTGKPRPSQGRYCFAPWNYFTKDSPLTPSGLLGPVRIMAE